METLLLIPLDDIVVFPNMNVTISADVGDESISVLASMPSLRIVNLYHTLLTETGAKKLKETLPKCQVIWDRDSARPNRRKT